MTKPDAAGLPVEPWPIARIKPYERNVRKTSAAAVNKVAQSIREFGWRQPLVVDEAGVLIAGRIRLLAAKRLGLDSVPVHVARGLSADQVKALRLADNRTHDETTWDRELLSEELRGLAFDALELTAFDQDELAELLMPKAPETEAGLDAERPPEAIAVSEPGDLWLCGQHRVLCGSATEPADVARACGGELASCVFTDPPYGISYESISGKHQMLAGDDQRSDELVRTLLEPAFRLAREHATDQAAFYIWHASLTREDFAFAMRAAGLEERQYLIWVKPQGTFGWSDYHWQHEPCFYGCKAGGSPAFYGGKTETTVWTIASGERDGEVATVLEPGVVLTDSHGHRLFVTAVPPKRRLRELRIAGGEHAALYETGHDGDVWRVSWDTNMPEHPTQKPVALVLRALMNSTLPGELVYDPFLGSGSTVIGAERVGRKAAGTELDEYYVDVIVRRWQEETGERATLEDDGRAFDEIAEERIAARG